MMIRGYEIGAKLILTVAGVVALIVAVLLLTNQCHSAKTAKKQEEVSRGEAGAAIQSGSEATNTLGNVMSNDAATEALVKRGQDEIAKAAAGQKGAAAKRAACRLKAYASSPQCRKPNP